MRHFPFVALLFRLAWCHVTLTFPEARFPPLDFLDTARTLGPCGLPKSDKSVYSTLKTGVKYNVTWRLQYPHQGGFRLTLIDYLGNQVETLAPVLKDSDANSSSFDGLQDQSAEWHQVEFQSICPNCTVVLERQALEWGPSYRFRSCAEVHVVEVPPDPEKQCLNRGSAGSDGSCKCQHGFSGKLCQYEDDCDTDKDCWNGGRCVGDGVFPNKKSCFCKYGFYGKDCRDRSGSVFENDDCFNHLNSDDVTGFMYGMFDPACYRRFNMTDVDAIYGRVLRDEIEIVLDFETESYVALGWRPVNIPNTCRLFPDLSKGREDSRVGGKTSGYAESALEASLHPMDCTDIVMASVAHGDFVHIEDMYTRDRSTPLNDKVLEGEQSLTAAYGIQRNGRTIVMFRRGIREIEPSDHPLGPGKIHLIHAKGQKQGNYQHLTPSAIEKKHAPNTFYKNDQWRYHGGENRGSHLIELVTHNEMHHGKTDLPSPPARPGLNQFRDVVLPRPTQSSIQVIDVGEVSTAPYTTPTTTTTQRSTTTDANPELRSPLKHVLSQNSNESPVKEGNRAEMMKSASLSAVHVVSTTIWLYSLILLI